MGKNRCAIPAGKLLIFSLLAFPLTLWVLEPHQLHYATTIIREVKSIALSIFGGGPNGSPNNLDRTKWVLSPNLSSCHAAAGRDFFPHNCCFSNPDLEESAIDFQLPDLSSSTRLRVRRPAHLLDDNYISKYKKALEIMKSLPYHDPRSFMRQADFHCTYCLGSYYEQHTNIPLDIHCSWFFFPWHRMFLYFHERILGSLIGDDTFALPFWAWDIPDGMMIPELYMNPPFKHSKRDPSHYPPTLIDLDFLCTDDDCLERGLSPRQQVDYNLGFMYHQVVSGARKLELFMGCPLKWGEEGFCEGTGTLEAAPHNRIHKWMGSGAYLGREDMGLTHSSARDPIFYAHHTNIDRVWEVWRGLNEDAIITDPDWLESTFYFHNEKAQLVRIRVRDVLNMTKLGYAYEEVEVPWLNRRPKPSVPPKVARQILKTRERELQLPSDRDLSAGPQGRTLDTSITMEVRRPSKRRMKGEEEVLIVYGIDVKGEDKHVRFDVYVNVVDETIMSPIYREFAGTYVHMPRRDDDEFARSKPTLKLGISELLEDLEADRDEFIWVTLLPMTSSCINASIDGMLIDYIQ